MKKLITIIALIALMFSTVNAQINPKIKVRIPANRNLNVDPNLNLEKIKSHLKSGAYCYDFNLATTTIIPPKTGGKRLIPFIGYFSTRRIKQKNEQLEIGGTLLKTNDIPLNNTKNRKGEHFTVFITPNPRDKKKIDARGVFTNWRLSGENLRTFQLRNVGVEYKPYGILITGSYEYNGILIGVTMTITPVPCMLYEVKS